jgi:hypothetical protein
VAMQKKSIKNGQVSEKSKTMGTQVPTMKKKRKEKKKEKIAHVLWQKCFPSFKQERHV